MFNGRMLNIIRYLKSHGQSSYKEVARDLNVSERSVRYDVDRINDILSLERLPEIESIPRACSFTRSTWILRGWRMETRSYTPVRSACPSCF